MIVYSELESVSRAAGLMILQVDGATASWWWQVDLVHGKCIFILGNPVAKCISVICRNDSYLCEKDKTSLWAVCTHCLTALKADRWQLSPLYLLLLTRVAFTVGPLPPPTLSARTFQCSEYEHRVKFKPWRNLLLEFSVFTFEEKWDNTHFWFSTLVLVLLTSIGLPYLQVWDFGMCLILCHI